MAVLWKQSLSSIHRQLVEAATTYPDVFHVAVLFDCHRPGEDAGTAALFILNHYPELFVRPIDEGPVDAVCHLPGATSLQSRRVLSSLYADECPGNDAGCLSIFCGVADRQCDALRRLQVSWFTVNWNSRRLALAGCGGHPAREVAASCREG